MHLDFCLLPNIVFSKAITDRSGIESCAVDDFFRGRKRFDTSLAELRDDYEFDESACLTFMGPDAFAFFLPLFMKLSVFDCEDSDNIPDSVVLKLHRMAIGEADHWLNAILKGYSRDQRNIVVEFLDEMSRIEWKYHDPDLAADAASAGVTINSRPAARVGDEVICPLHGPGVITSGGLASIGGRTIAHHGSGTTCGATLIVTDAAPLT